MEWFDVIKRLFDIKNPLGYSADEVEELKRRYGNLPKTLEQFFLQLGRSDELHRLQDELFLPGKWPVFLDYSHLVFFNENQGVCQAGIDLNDLGKENPPVYVGYDNAEWIKTTDTVSDFLVAMFGYQAACWGLRYAEDGIYWITENEVEVIGQHFSKQPVSLKNWMYSKIDLYASSPDDRIALLDAGVEGLVQMVYAANNQDTFDKMQGILKNIGEPV